MGSILPKGQNLETAPRTAAVVAHNCDDSSSKGACLPHPAAYIPCPKKQCFHPLASAETSPIPVSDCSHHEPSHILQHLFWLLDCSFLGTKKHSWHHLLQVQLGFWAPLRYLTGEERDVWSHISMSCTFELWSECSLGYFLSCSREVSPAVTQVNLHGWLCEQQSHHQTICIDGQPIECSGKRERSQN